MKLKNILIVYATPTNNIQKMTLELVKCTFKKHKINFDIIRREKLNKNLFQKKDLIIAVGGDGTFLLTSHFIFNKTPLLGVNSDPSSREGFFMVSEKKDFVRKFKKLLGKKFKIKKLHRLEAFIENKKVPELALNEFYIAAERPYHTARYYFSVRGKRERQKSSGVLISTAAGSYAWIKSAGGIELPLYSDKFEYLIREPYCGRTAAKCSLVNGILNKNEKIMIDFEIGNGLIIADSTGKEHKFKSKHKVIIKVSNKPLHTISFSK